MPNQRTRLRQQTSKAAFEASSAQRQFPTSSSPPAPSEPVHEAPAASFAAISIPLEMEAQRQAFVVMEVSCKLTTKSVPRQADAESFLNRFYDTLEEDGFSLPRIMGQATVSLTSDGRACLKQRFCFTAEDAERMEQLEEGAYTGPDFQAAFYRVGGPRILHLLVVGVPYYAKQEHICSILSAVPNVISAEVQPAFAYGDLERADAVTARVRVSGPLQRFVPIKDSTGSIVGTLRLDRKVPSLPVLRPDKQPNPPLPSRARWPQQFKQQQQQQQQQQQPSRPPPPPSPPPPPPPVVPPVVSAAEEGPSRMEVLRLAPKRPPGFEADPEVGIDDGKSARAKREYEMEPHLQLEGPPGMERPSGQELEWASSSYSEAEAQATFAVVASFVGVLHAKKQLAPHDYEALKSWSDRVGVKFRHASFLPAVARFLNLPPPT